MRRLAPLALLSTLLPGCTVVDEFPFVSGVYADADHGEWLDLRVEDGELVFYEASEASLDAGGNVQGTVDHREPLHPFHQDERGDACGDGLSYAAANLDAMVTFQLGTTFFAWPYLVWDCDGVHLLLSEHQDTLDCADLSPCWVFEPLASD